MNTPHPLKPSAPHHPPKKNRNPMQRAWWLVLGVWAVLLVGVGLYAVVLGASKPQPVPEPEVVKPAGVSPNDFIDRLRKQAEPPERKSAPETNPDPQASEPVVRSQALQIGRCVLESKQMLEGGSGPSAAAAPASAASASADKAPALSQEEEGYVAAVASRVSVVMDERVQNRGFQDEEAWANDLVAFACAVYKSPQVVALRRASKVADNLFPSVAAFHVEAWKRSERMAIDKNQRNERAHMQAVAKEQARVDAAKQQAQMLHKWVMFVLASGLVVLLYMAVVDAVLRLRKQEG